MLFALFAASGFAGLVYESIWTHYLKLFLGHAAYAQTLVLAIFMGGMAVGSWISSRWSGRVRNLLRGYALTEAAIGVLGLIFHEVFTAATALAYDHVFARLADSSVEIGAFKWSLCALLILPQSILLGMTFPLMTAGVLRAFPDRPGRTVAMLYFTNSLGAAVGVVVSGFVLVRAVGLPGTVRVAALINVAVAAGAWVLARDRAQPAIAHLEEQRPRDRAWLFFLAVALATGATSFVYEVVWIRMLALVLGASTHAFELMLSAFILGLALGGLWIRRRIDKLGSPVRVLGYLQLAMGVLAVGTLPAYSRSFHFMQWLLLRLPPTDRGYALFNLASNGIALAIMLPATFCAGTTLPLITYHLLRRGNGESSIGAVYAANTVGAIAGVFLAVHAGLPLLGVKRLLGAAALGDAALGVMLLWTAAAGFTRRRVPLALTASGAALLALPLIFARVDPRYMASGVYRAARLLDPSDELLFHRDGKTATVSVVRQGGTGVVNIRTNGKTDAELTTSLDQPADLDEPTMVLLGALPMALHPEARTVACIGFGSGLTTHTLLANPRLSRVDTIEIEPEMVNGARYFRPRNELAFTDPRSNVVIDDAKTFFSIGQRKYDVIVSEPSNPWVSGVAGLFSDEFYRLARRHLAPGGVFVQWVQLYEIDVPLVVSVLKAVEANFDDYVAYAPNEGDLFIAAKNGSRFGPPDPSPLMVPAVARELGRVGIRNMQDLELRRVGTRSTWQGLTRAVDVPMNSDYRPVLDQEAVKARYLHLDAKALVVFQKQLFPTVEMLSGFGMPGSITSVTLSRLYSASRLGAEAMWLRDAFLGRVPVNDQVVSDPQLHAAAREVVEWMAACPRRPMPLAGFVRVAQAMIPFLTPGDLDEIWYALASRGCARNLSQQDRDWVALLQAAGQRDGARLASAARQLLAAEPNLAPPSKRYLVAAAMLGSFASGSTAQAREAWKAVEPSLGAPDDLLLRVFVARALQ